MKLSQWWVWRVASRDFTFSKRQLGQALAVGGALGFAAILAIDIVNIGREGGLGPAQQAALAVMAVVALLGVSLLPLGNDPA